MKQFRQNRLLLGISTCLLTAALSVNTTAQSPYTKPDEALITISGTVDKIYNDSFTLNYGHDDDDRNNTITVEMDDGDRDADAYKLRHGDDVTVTGRIDADFYEKTTIEAGSVYVDTLDTYFYSSAIDEEDYYLPMVYRADLTLETLRGRVTETGDDHFTLLTGTEKITIEVDSMANNPLDDVGYPQVDKNDIVAVRGHIDVDMFKNHSFDAEGITTILDFGG